MGSKKNKVQETESERALADVARQQMADFAQRWRPQQMRLAEGVAGAAAPGSWERRRADTMAKTDTGVAFAGAREKLNTQAAAGGEFGGSRHKLGLAGVGNDQATSSGMSSVVADQAGDDAYVQGLGAVTALGRGEKATAISGMSTAAAISAKQAQFDAARALDNRMGNARLVGQGAGIGAGLYMGKQPSGAGVDWSGAPDELPNETARLLRAGRT